MAAIVDEALGFHRVAPAVMRNITVAELKSVVGSSICLRSLNFSC